MQLAHKLQTSTDQITPEPFIKKLHITARKETTHYMRDGEVVLYLRPDSKVWQVRYKLFDHKWRCVSTRHRQLEWAKKVAVEMYDRARFREEEGLPQKSVRFATLANECIRVLKVEIERGMPQARQVGQPPVNASLAPKDGVFAPDIAQKNSDVHGDDRHSKNGYPPLSQVNRVIPKAPARVGSYTK